MEGVGGSVTATSKLPAAVSKLPVPASKLPAATFKLPVDASAIGCTSRLNWGSQRYVRTY